MVAPQPINVRPLHNVEGSLRSLARQTLADLDDRAITTTLPTATVRLLLELLVEALDRPPPAPRPAAPGLLTEAAIALPAKPPEYPTFWHAAQDDDE